MGGTHGADDVLGMSVVRGVRGVDRVYGMRMFSVRVG